MHDRTRSLACKIESRKHTSEYRYAETFRPSLRNGFADYSALPGVRLVSHRPLGLLTRGLILASEDQDQTLLPTARCIPRQMMQLASIASRPTSVTTRTPLVIRTRWMQIIIFF
jgi:hypothetical protein